ncbi:MAG: hypothetical protein HQL11_00390 [Candidatus Omnitrophica bacterium]|nr:hypothetical protein [Candidatus Omnitrophota bacterium]
MSKTIKCHVCSGEMKPYVGPRHNRRFGMFLAGAGVVSTLFWIGPVLGIPLMAMGGYMAGSKRKLFVCSDCHTAIERLEVKMEPKGRTAKQAKETVEAEAV